ncbi:MAG: hypothetical protein WA239_13510, partial [Candidatus Sulfotelmatobacter sp.]
GWQPAGRLLIGLRHHSQMRNTVTLDPDVEKMLQNAIRERGVTFRQALSDASCAAACQSEIVVGGTPSGRETVGLSWIVLGGFLAGTALGDHSPSKPPERSHAARPPASFGHRRQPHI